MRNNKYQRVVLVGCGKMSKKWLDYLAKHVELELVALVDVNVSAAEARANEIGGSVPIFSSLNKALEETNPTVVCDVTIPEVHSKVAITAMRHGCHVFSEKPMADSFEDACAASVIASQTGLTYAVMQNRRYNNSIRVVKGIVESGQLGEIGMVNASFYLGPHFGGFRDKMLSPLLLDMAIHTFDQARFISSQDPLSVYCHEFNPAWSWYAHGSSASVIFEMTNELVFTYLGSWCTESLKTSWESEWSLIGSKGSLHWDGEDKYKIELNSEAELVFPDTYEGAIGHEGCLDEMFTSLGSDTIPQTTYQDNIKSLAMVFGSIESAKRQQKIDIKNLYTENAKA